jgi:hypothetical protein
LRVEREPRSVTAQPLSTQQLEKEAYCFILMIEGVLYGAAASADTSPTAHEASLAKQRPFNRKGVKSSHVPLRVTAFDMELVL